MIEGQIIGIIIGIIAALAFVGGLIWLLVTGTKPIWPKGARVHSEVHYGHKPTLIWGEGVKIDWALMEASARAAFYLQKVWENSGKPKYKLKEFGVHILKRRDFENGITWRDHPEMDNGYLTSASQRLGDPPPVIVIPDDMVKHAIDSGQPIIHELLHDRNGLRFDRDHMTYGVWKHTNGDRSIEALAQEAFKG